MPTVSALKKWGNSQGVVINRKICEQSGIQIGDSIDIYVNNRNEIVISAKAAKRYSRSPRKITIDQLFESYEVDGSGYQPNEPDWGEPVGAEIGW